MVLGVYSRKVFDEIRREPLLIFLSPKVVERSQNHDDSTERRGQGVWFVVTHGDVEVERDAQAHLVVSEECEAPCRTEMELRHDVLMDGELRLNCNIHVKGSTLEVCSQLEGDACVNNGGGGQIHLC